MEKKWAWVHVNGHGHGHMNMNMAINMTTWIHPHFDVDTSRWIHGNGCRKWTHENGHMNMDTWVWA